MESRFDADCNLCRRRDDRRLSNDPRDEIRDAASKRDSTWNAFCDGSLRARLHLTPDQDEKLRPIMQQADNELRNLRALDLHEIKGILDRAEERVNPVLTPDQRQRLRQMLEDRKQRLDEWFNVPEPHD